jgi:hypothetical protein
MNQTKFKDYLSAMPPLHHTLPGQEFDINKSEVTKYIMAHPDILNWITSRAIGTHRIVYDNETGRWSGVVRGSPGRPTKAASGTSQAPDSAPTETMDLDA